MTDKVRFSKSSLMAMLSKRADDYEGTYGFHSDDGYHQVEGRDIATVVAFGRYSMLLELLEEM